MVHFHHISQESIYYYHLDKDEEKLIVYLNQFKMNDLEKANNIMSIKVPQNNN